MTECLEFARPMVRRCAGFHPDQARFETRHEREHLRPSETLANNRCAIRIDSVNLKYSLGKINADCANLHVGDPHHHVTGGLAIDWQN
jgi:hypothetical protein